jgi:site-specific recombinase XerD
MKDQITEFKSLFDSPNEPNENAKPTTAAETAVTLAAIRVDAILKDATPELLNAIAREVMKRRLVDHMDTAAKLTGIDYETERETFIKNAGHTSSYHTRRTYRTAIVKLEQYADTLNKNPLELTTKDADNFIYDQRASGAASATVRVMTAALSSFYSFLERRHDAIRNPFRGTKARPRQKAARNLDIPDADEVKTIIEALPPKQRTAVAMMAYRGLRCGALPELDIWGGKFKTFTKGEERSGTFSPEILAAIRSAGLNGKKPFEGTNANAIERNLNYHIGKLYKVGKIRARYSAHDFRHFYAVTEYRKDHDIYRVSKLLHHSGIAITETYLRGLGEMED